MTPRFITASMVILTLAGALQAQTMQRRATMRGGNRPGNGKCTVEVVVDGAVQIEIRGDVANMRNLNGQPPQWRRFECDSVMPNNPANFHFAGVDGRGRQTLISDPRNGAAVIQIEDPDNGAQGYTFDITWDNNGGGYQSGNGYPNNGNRGAGYGNGNGNYNGNNGNGNNGNYNGNGAGNGNYRNGGNGRFSADQAVQACQDAIRVQARNQFRANDVNFRRTQLDDQPGRNDYVVGSLEMRNQNGGAQIARFSCSVNFDNGRVRSAQIEQPHWNGQNNGQNGFGGGGMSQAAIQNCQRAVTSRLRTEGYDRPQFTSIRADDQQGRNDWVVGDVRVNGQRGQESLRFSCSVDMRDGDIRSVDINSRR